MPYNKAHNTQEVTTLQKFKMIVIGLGFFWIFSWCIFGSILGTQIEALATSLVEPSGYMIWQRTLLRSSHAHMNSMGITTILLGLSIGHIRSTLSEKKIKTIIILNLISIPIFGMGIILEAFFPVIIGKFSLVTSFSAIGGIIYIITMGIWSSLFIFSALKKNG
jgi:hypothetical protein